MKIRYDKRDGNEHELVAFAKNFGAHYRIGPPLDGWLWIPRQARWIPVEIKLPEREGLAHEYTPLQRRFLSFCKETGAPWFVWRNKDDVTRDLGGRRAA